MVLGCISGDQVGLKPEASVSEISCLHQRTEYSSWVDVCIQVEMLHWFGRDACWWNVKMVANEGNRLEKTESTKPELQLEFTPLA